MPIVTHTRFVSACFYCYCYLRILSCLIIFVLFLLVLTRFIFLSTSLCILSPIKVNFYSPNIIECVTLHLTDWIGDSILVPSQWSLSLVIGTILLVWQDLLLGHRYKQMLVLLKETADFVSPEIFRSLGQAFPGLNFLSFQGACHRTQQVPEGSVGERKRLLYSVPLSPLPTA